MLAPHAAFAGGPAQPTAGTPTFGAAAANGGSGPATDQLIVKYRSSTSAPRFGATAAQQRPQTGAALARFGVQMQVQRQLAPDTQVVRLSRKLAASEAADLARSLAADDPNVEYAEPDRIMTIQATPTDPRYGEQWQYFDRTGGLNLPAAWDRATGSGVVVAVLDTGFRPHVDLKANLLPGYDFINDSFVGNDGNGRDADASDPGDAIRAGECGGGQPFFDQPSSWHGTHVAGTVAAVANNSTGVVGVAFNAKVLPVRVLGKCGGYTSDIAQAIIWASGGSVSGVPANPTPARVINLSLGGGGACDRTTQDAINTARQRGTVVVVAAGNESQDAANSSPASCQGVVTVAATNRSGGRASYSNFGSTVEVAAPGGDTRSGESGGILSTLNTGSTSPGSDSYAYYQGTSMASPHVAGVVALVLERNRQLNPDQVSSLLASTARAFPSSCSGCGRGLVDAAAAVAAAAGGGGGGGGGGEQPGTVSESEPNDTLREADVISQSGSVAVGAMDRAGDRDFYSATVPAGGTLNVKLAPGATADYDLYVWNASGRLVGRSIRGAGERDEVTLVNRAGAVPYYVEVRYYDGDTGRDEGRYTLDFSF
ncbi:peptidase S8 [Caldimonas brevitalea]|uniref:Peptidase S8 n=1 Tax=Caldimonas brevitalea TaxID=413882 RepID=A0A0G3BRW0_9BURK|nr:peptidase S8 [Caldimonas brevitalea]